MECLVIFSITISHNTCYNSYMHIIQSAFSDEYGIYYSTAPHSTAHKKYNYTVLQTIYSYSVITES